MEAAGIESLVHEAKLEEEVGEHWRGKWGKGSWSRLEMEKEKKGDSLME